VPINLPIETFSLSFHGTYTVKKKKILKRFQDSLSLSRFLLDFVVLVAVILQAILVLEGLQADVAREARRVVVVDGEMLSETTGKREAFCADGTFVCLVVVVELVIL
jgi:hypothetical protein